jgi:hypothetical protein
VHSAGYVDSRQRPRRPSDGLPSTDEQQVFIEMVRNGVVLAAPPPDDASHYVVSGPFRSNGLIPGNNEDRWLAVRTVYSSALEACSQRPAK